MQCWSCNSVNNDGAHFCSSCGAGLGCTRCGVPIDPTRNFCTNCGLRSPARGAQTIVRRIRLHVEETPHFRIHFHGGSVAEQNLAVIAGRLEFAYDAMTPLLGIPSGAQFQPSDGQEPAFSSTARDAGTRIDVYLSEMLEDPEGNPVAGGGFAIPVQMAIYEVFRADAPGQGLERSLLTLLLAIATGNDRSRPPLLIDGLLALVSEAQRAAFVGEVQGTPGAPGPDTTIWNAELGVARGRRQLPPIASLVRGPRETTRDIYPAAAGSFIGYLLRTYGIERFRGFARRLGPGNLDEALRLGIGAPLLQVEKDWVKTLKARSPGGILRFLRLSSVYLRPHKLKVAEIVFYLVLSVGFSLALTSVQRVLIDRALPRTLPDGTLGGGDPGLFTLVIGILVSTFVIVSVTGLRENYLSAYVSESVTRELRIRIFTIVQRVHLGFFNRVQTGDILSRMTSDLAAIEFALTGALAQGLQIALTLVAAIVTIFLMDVRLAVLALVGTPLFFVIGRWLGPAAARASFERQEHLATATSTLQENLSAQPVVKAFGLENLQIVRYRRELDTLFRSSIKLQFLSSIFGLSANSIASAIQLSLLGVGGWLLLRGSGLSAGTLFAFLGIAGLIIGPIQSVSGLLQSLQQASGAMDRVDELLKAEPAIKDKPNAVPLGRLQRGINFENVSFSYTGEQPTLHNLDLAIPAGSSVAFVGPSGCGKSTTLNLIMRFYDVAQGRITLDGVDVRDASLESLRGQMGVVFQDNFLFNFSIRENIRLGNPSATDADVEAAARAAEIHELIVGMPQGYDTVVGERGGRLSGGQRQRVAIARAIVRNPAILILDEATSALDPRTEAAINATLDQIARGRTTITVTHRLASVINADRIYVLDRGSMVEQGTHDELVARGGLYALLWQEQGGFVLEAGVQYVGVEAARLQGVSLFQHLDGDLLAWLARRLAVERYPAGDEIVRAGDVGDKLFIVHRGQVDVLSVDSAGRERSMSVLREGEHFGEAALLFDAPRTATIRARSPVQLYSLSRDDFKQLLARVPGLRDTLLQTMAQRTRAQRQPNAPRS